MKINIIVFFLCLGITNLFGCDCQFRTVKQEIEFSDLIFRGTVKNSYVTENGMLYEFEFDKVWKGRADDLIQIKTGLGGGDCGSKFTKDMTYIIYSTNKITSICRRNNEISKTSDDLKLDYQLDTKLKEIVFNNSKKKLNINESDYLNRQFKTLAERFDFSNKAILFTNETDIISKQSWYKSNWNHDNPVVELVILNQKEKDETGYDAILVSWSKIKMTERMKNSILRKAKRKAKRKSSR